MAQMTSKQQELVRRAERFAQENIAVSGKDEDPTEQARRLYAAYARDGYHALLIPEQYGGKGLDYTSTGIVYETLSYHQPGTLHAPITTAHCIEMIKCAHQDARHDTYLSNIARKGLAVGFCLTEDSAGSDITSISTTAQKTAQGFVLNGKKSIVINHAIASYLIVFATISPEKGRAGINAFVVDPGLEGITLSDPYAVEGFAGSVMGEVILDKVLIDRECLLGEEGSGYFLLMETLDKGRPLVAASCTGAANRVFDIIVSYTKDRHQFGKDLFSFQGVSLPLAEYATRLHASRLLYLDALERIDGNQSFSMEASMAKLFGSQTLSEIASFAMDIFGYRGIVDHGLVQQVYHDAQLMKSIDGTGTVQKMVISSQL
ncbi:MAG TPA: acyl-CoA dehydrogenase family protein [Deltaproteobacteria bacterium]|nr:acyl-CoA dehydrogenase family protein [Deltaproteobacteria bacterium]HPJ94921.1 acyl-CoA dehydrogenase family protein [Deltaproteobacteria bacterium]